MSCAAFCWVPDLSRTFWPWLEDMWRIWFFLNVSAPVLSEEHNLIITGQSLQDVWLHSPVFVYLLLNLCAWGLVSSFSPDVTLCSPELDPMAVIKPPPAASDQALANWLIDPPTSRDLPQTPTANNTGLFSLQVSNDGFSCHYHPSCCSSGSLQKDPWEVWCKWCFPLPLVQ